MDLPLVCIQSTLGIDVTESKCCPGSVEEEAARVRLYRILELISCE